VRHPPQRLHRPERLGTALLDEVEHLVLEPVPHVRSCEQGLDLVQDGGRAGRAEHGSA
jgi:hypothetical protein